MNSLRKSINQLLLFLIILLCGCSARFISYSNKKNTLRSYDHLNDSTLRITDISKDKEFGFSEFKPIMLGLQDIHKGADNIEKYMRALQGPNGEPLKYYRLKACCPFRTRNFVLSTEITPGKKNDFEGKYGMLEKYHLEYKEGTVIKSFNLFFNLYDETKTLLAPHGLTFRNK